MRASSKSVLTGVLLGLMGSAYAVSPLVRPAALEPALRDGIVGALNYLLTTQIDCSDQLEPGGYLCNKQSKSEKRVQGGWDSVIDPTFKILNGISVLDSNMFVTAAVLYPYWFLDSTAIPALDTRRSAELGMQQINLHRRGEGYSFWTNLGPGLGSVDRIGPMNISTTLLSSQVEVVRRLEKTTRLQIIPDDIRWVDGAFTDANSALKADVLFSVPSDADDTALGIISNYNFLQDRIAAQPSERELEFLKSVISNGHAINRFTDTMENRSRRPFRATPRCQERAARGDNPYADLAFVRECSLDDAREFWRYDAYAAESSFTGSYLTWLQPETENPFAQPEKGVLLPGQNSIDCVVIANALLAISSTGLKDNPEFRGPYEASCNTVTNLILDERDRIRRKASGRSDGKDTDAVWSYCGLFYPGHLLFPYKLSRAVRDGGACKDLSNERDQRRFNQAVGALAAEVIAEQKGDHWFEPMDASTEMPTAMATVTLLNLGSELAELGGVPASRLDESIRKGLTFLVREKDPKPALNGLPSYTFEPGLFFGGGGLNEIAFWRSPAVTTAIFLEGAIKFLQGRHLSTHLASAQPDRAKLVMSRLRTEGGLAAFDAAQVPVDDAGFKSRYLSDFLGDAARIASTHESRERDFPLTAKERFEVIVPRKHSASFEAGLQITDRGEYGVVGLQFETGEIVEAGTARAAYYLVKMKTRAATNTADARDVNWRMEASFLGISSDSPMIRDEMGFLPVVIVKEKDLASLETHLLQANAQLPMVALGPSLRLDLQVGAKMLGLVYKEMKRTGSDELSRARGGSLGELELGVEVRYRNTLSMGAAVRSGYHLMDVRGGDTRREPSRPLTASAKLNLNISQNVNVGVEYVQVKDNLLYEKPEKRVNLMLGVKWK
ncbi:MAG: hypothetical protein NDJ90_09740 [Oligoflexia bacterium]|nr:hypothetical protein [Oligoflexia bacterium]